MSVGLRGEGIPIQTMLEAMLSAPVRLTCNDDNTQALAAVERGYSKKLRHVAKTHRINVGFLHECASDPGRAISFGYCPTAQGGFVYQGDAGTVIFEGPCGCRSTCGHGRGRREG